MAFGGLKTPFGTKSTVHLRYISGTVCFHQAQKGSGRLPVMLERAGQGTHQKLQDKARGRAGETPSASADCPRMRLVRFHFPSAFLIFEIKTTASFSGVPSLWFYSLLVFEVCLLSQLDPSLDHKAANCRF